MGVFGDLFTSRSSAANQAKKRLMMVCSYNHNGLPAGFMNEVKKSLLGVFAKYPQFKSSQLDVTWDNQDDVDQLSISVPLKR